jgi:ubiquinone/menaquinone biosynthesis C-methylase UbiE
MIKYVGSELNVFSNAKNWKRYISKHLRHYVNGDVLEVGSGLGSVTGVLSDSARRWMCLEPDPDLLARARSLLSNEKANCEFVVGTLETMAPEEVFDAILYIDVLEHIEDDGLELIRASRHVKRGGVICVLAPAHPKLYSAFDRGSVISILKSAAPSVKQITFWDRVLVSLSRILDPVFGYSVGKSVLAVWRRLD